MSPCLLGLCKRQHIWEIQKACCSAEGPQHICCKPNARSVGACGTPQYKAFHLIHT